MYPFSLYFIIIPLKKVKALKHHVNYKVYLMNALLILSLEYLIIKNHTEIINFQELNYTKKILMIIMFHSKLALYLLDIFHNFII